MNTIISDILGVLFSICLIFILLITSFEAVCYWVPGYYDREFKKYDVASELEYWMGEEMSYESFSYVIDETMQYLRGNRDDLVIETEIDGVQQEFYNDNEISHMADVRDLFVLCIRLRWAAIAVCILVLLWFQFGRYTNNGEILSYIPAYLVIGKCFLKTEAVIAAAAAIIGILATSDFTKYFTRFHQIFFSQGNWLFDPRESRMINMLPEGFFSDTALYILLTFMGAMIVCCVAAYYFGWVRVRRKYQRG